MCSFYEQYLFSSWIHPYIHAFIVVLPPFCKNSEQRHSEAKKIKWLVAKEEENNLIFGMDFV